ncbi:hypothetical protein E3N88_22227 [Mikania micrantha]|uniref:Cytochrome P450 n=1 Tax=Mikania micrantha TaxID=192012 RepID=A0A5N6N9S4_9ASTR|nr:hypothetical protein E3N88_22227 [Mikania micrantha]
MVDFQPYFFHFLILLISTIFILAFFKSKNAKSHLPPSPFSLPIIGHLHLLTPNPHQAFHRLSLRYGPITAEAGAFNLSDNIWLFKKLDLQWFGKRVKDIHRRFDALIEKIIKEHEESQSQEKDLLNILLRIAEDETMDIHLTRENIKAFILNIFVAGTDNSALAPEWGLSELINHPNIMRKAVAEIDNVVGKDRLIQESDVENLPYLQAIIKETLRLHPPVPLIPRKSTEDRTVAGYHIQANTSIYINTWALGRDPNHWENPLEFMPERFEEKPMDVRGQHFEFLPFGSGRRMCPGTSLGLKMVYATFGAMIQCFEWKAGEDGNLARVDMDEGCGFNLPKANPLVCVPVARLDPIPMHVFK